MRHPLPILLLSLQTVIISTATLSAEAEKEAQPRTWTSITGASIEAAFVSEGGGRVILRKEDGTEMTILLHRLSQADRDWIAETRSASEPQAEEEGASPSLLPVFTSGPWRNYNAVYQHAHFDALLRKDAVLFVHLKEKGERFGQPITLRMNPYYVAERPRRGQVGRPIETISNPPQPTTSPKQIVINGMLKDSVEFELVYDFSGNTISAWGWCRDPRDIELPTTYRLWLQFPKTHDIPDLMPLSEQEELLAGHSVKVYPYEGRVTEYPYFGTARMTGIVRETITQGPVYRSRVIKVRGPDPRRAPVRPWIYAGYSPWQGYAMHLTKEIQDQRVPNQRITLIIE